MRLQTLLELDPFDPENPEHREDVFDFLEQQEAEDMLASLLPWSEEEVSALFAAYEQIGKPFSRMTLNELVELVRTTNIVTDYCLFCGEQYITVERLTDGNPDPTFLSVGSTA